MLILTYWTRRFGATTLAHIATVFAVERGARCRSKSGSTRILAKRWAERLCKERLNHASRVLAPWLLALTHTSVAHAQGTMDFSGARKPSWELSKL
jgi:hypothetical protein